LAPRPTHGRWRIAGLLVQRAEKTGSTLTGPFQCHDTKSDALPQGTRPRQTRRARISRREVSMPSAAKPSTPEAFPGVDVGDRRCFSNTRARGGCRALPKLIAIAGSPVCLSSAGVGSGAWPVEGLAVRGGGGDRIRPTQPGTRARAFDHGTSLGPEDRRPTILSTSYLLLAPALSTCCGSALPLECAS